MDTFKIASIDIGTINFALVIEEFSESNKVRKVAEFALVTFGTSKCALSEICARVTAFLDTKALIFADCSVVLIEKQFFNSKRKQYNVRALRIFQHVWSYFSIIYGPFKQIIEFPSYLKTVALGMTKESNVSKLARKKFSVVRAGEILAERGDEYLATFYDLKKKDDIADCLCQIEAYFIKKGSNCISKIF